MTPLQIIDMRSGNIMVSSDVRNRYTI